MTQSISTGETPSEGTLTEVALRGMVGYLLFMTAQLGSLYSPILSTAQTAEAPAFCLMRCAALGCTAAFYFVFSRFVHGRDRLVRSAAAKAGGTLAQLPLPLLVIFEATTGAEAPLAVVTAAWMLWGFAHGLLTCSWTDAKSNLEESSATKIAFWSFALSAFLITGLLMLVPAAGLGALVLMGAVACALLLVAPRRAGGDSSEYGDEWLRAKSSFRISGSYVMVVDGALISFAAGVMIMSALRGQFPIVLVGVAFIGAAAVFYALKKTNAALLSLRRSQLVFLPLIAGGLAVMGFAKTPTVGIVAFILFSILYLFDFANRSVLSLRSNLLPVSPTYCFSRGRIFIIVGQAIGWVLAAYLTSSGAAAAPVVTTTLTVLMCAYVSIGTANPEKYPLIDGLADDGMEATPPPQDDLPAEEPVVEHPYRSRCLRAAQRYDLTPREGEILSYLARGRNAKYIADQLFVAERTVKTHTYHIYQKMDIHSQQELINIVEGME